MRTELVNIRNAKRRCRKLSPAAVPSQALWRDHLPQMRLLGTTHQMTALATVAPGMRQDKLPVAHIYPLLHLEAYLRQVSYFAKPKAFVQ